MWYKVRRTLAIAKFEAEEKACSKLHVVNAGGLAKEHLLAAPTKRQKGESVNSSWHPAVLSETQRNRNRNRVCQHPTPSTLLQLLLRNVVGADAVVQQVGCI